jgi:uncharacterized protein (DUF1800 family)
MKDHVRFRTDPGRGRHAQPCRGSVLAILTALALAPVLSPIAAGGAVKRLEAGGAPASWMGDLSPIAATDWNYARAGHLLERAGFGATPEEIEALARMTPEDAVNSLVDYESVPNAHLPAFDESGIFDPGMLEDLDRRFDDFTEGVRAARRQPAVYGVRPSAEGPRRLQPIIDKLYYAVLSDRYEWDRATIWWANWMLNTHRPLEEKLTLFWHGHFATEDSKVRDYRLMLRYLETLRRNASGSFRTLLAAISRDPAMLVYLDNRKNVKGHANENYAREILELFTLGAGNYSEHDIKEVARAFTGWGNLGLTFVDREELHDDGAKTVLGATGAFDGEQVIDVILKQPAAAEFISAKLYRFLVREDLSPALKAALATRLRSNDYALKPLLKMIFLSKDFYSEASYATQVKSPVVLAVSTYRKLGLTEVPGSVNFPRVTAELGQALGNPPNVKGWDGGKTWINPSTLLQRGNFALQVLFAGEPGSDPQARLIPETYRNAPSRTAERDRMAALGGANEEAAKPKTALQMITRSRDYDLALGVYNGLQMTFEKVKPVPPTPPTLDLAAMVRKEGLETAGDAVNYFERRFLRLPLDDRDRAALVEFLERRWGSARIDYQSAALENSFRELIHLIMSTPEYQLS